MMLLWSLRTYREQKKESHLPTHIFSMKWNKATRPPLLAPTGNKYPFCGLFSATFSHSVFFIGDFSA